MNKRVVDAKKLICSAGISFSEINDLLVPLSFFVDILGIFKKTKSILYLKDFYRKQMISRVFGR